MSKHVWSYLAGLCHGLGVVWIVGYILYKSSVPLSSLFDPRHGVLPVGIALLPLIAGGTLIQVAARRGRAERAADTRNQPIDSA